MSSVVDRYKREFDRRVYFPAVLRDLVFSYLPFDGEELLANLAFLIEKCYGNFPWEEGIAPGPAKDLTDRLVVCLRNHPSLIRIPKAIGSFIRIKVDSYRSLYNAVSLYLFRERHPGDDRELSDFYGKSLVACSKWKETGEELRTFNAYQRYAHLIAKQLPEALQKLYAYEKADRSSCGPCKKIKKLFRFSPF